MNNDERYVYLDTAASTPVDERVHEAMRPYFSDHFANPGAIHSEGELAREHVEQARTEVADFLNCQPQEIIFTSGGTEANNLAISGVVSALLRKKPHGQLHVGVSAIEHPSVLEIAERAGGGESIVSQRFPVTREGVLDRNGFKSVLAVRTVLVSIMLANNEIGTIQPISDISRTLRRRGKDNFFKLEDVELDRPILHTDASQAPLYLELDVEKLGVDLLTLDGQKVYGPKGVGVLYVRDGVELDPIMLGGDQEKGLRPGTEPVPLIVGMARALSIARDERERVATRVQEVRDYFIDRLTRDIEGVRINGSRQERIANNVNITIEGKRSEYAVLQLDARGIACGTRSACMRDGTEGSYVMEALCGDPKSGIRFSLGRDTTKEDIDYVIAALGEIMNN